MGVEDGSDNVSGSNGSLGALASVGSFIGSVKEKWDSSGGNEVLSNMSSAIPQGTRDSLFQAKSKLFNRSRLRSPTVFFGIGEERPFYLERSMQLLLPRMQHNVSFFYLNYMLVTAVLFVLTLLITPSAIIGIGLLALVWVWLIKSTQSGSLTVKGITISQKQATIGMSGISVLVLFYLLSHVFWLALSTSGFLVALHAFFRDASMHKDEEDKVEMLGDLSLEENASFLGQDSANVDVV